MTVHFSCTMCGRCCHGLRLPVSVSEAMAWLRDGGNVQLFCEAIPWPEEPAADNGLAQHKRRRSFAALSGTMPVRVIVSLMAAFDGACPNLLPDMRCGIYERRPQVCRIYPAELNPFVALEPSSKMCPPEAWQSDEIIRDEAGEWTDPATVDAIHASRAADQRDGLTKAHLCSRLGHAVAALSNEGIAVHSPDAGVLLAALEEALADDGDPQVEWTVVSNRSATLGLLQSAGMTFDRAPAEASRALQYVGFFETDDA